MHERTHDRKALLTCIQEVEFAALELNLYLDTHRCDQKALARYNHLHQQLMALKKQYEMAHGPLLNFGFSPSRYPWQWVEGPWPWEKQY
ncbi:spore coat peptide assembly protein cotJB [Alkaliphilus metalliredigens QYMF]|uniref:Spore coat peptide assembly protein cotJB n=1 Tax=Alkaliphilus metalliredigens (strain QYMF) TaxID=293826 RepID=A6TUA8_ALKMQ|nr:spore coat protein CotJB [Alkaliphilus metalliredigens]ABR49776.1 spore coat peptide assembly protein cotJB [Alkaliphilus metalliredigens QYMF]